MNLYESERLSTVTGPTLRPGGLDLTREMLKLCRLEAAAAILDMGCGAGVTLTLLEQLGHCPYGVDISAMLLAKAANAAPNAILARASAAETPFSAAYFDLVMGECVLSLISPPVNMLKEAWRVLKPNGLLGLTDIYIREFRPDAACAPENVKSCLDGAMQLSELQELLKNTNFEIIHLVDHTAKLKQLTAELIFAYGSLKAFWDFFSDPELGSTFGGACGHKYGYYMLIARKIDG